MGPVQKDRLTLAQQMLHASRPPGPGKAFGNDRIFQVKTFLL